MTSFDRNNQISCHEAQLLMSAYMKDDPSLTQEQREAFEAHLMICSACQREYAEDKQLIALVKKYWGAISKGTRKLPVEEGGYRIPEQEAIPPRRTRPMTVKESWEDLKRRSPSLAAACRRQEEKDRRRRLFWRIGSAAAAASILVAVSIGWIVLQDQGDGQPGPDVVATQTQDETPANVFAELVTPSGRQKLTLGQPIRAGDQPQEILLGGKHRVVMNADASAVLTADPVYIDTERRARYAIQLAKGEIYVEVVPGHPFTVRTDNALLDITGTKFDVLAEPGRTELTLVKGSVRFSHAENANHWVDVTAGHASSILGRSAPTAPERIDALAATSWARDFLMRNALARVQPEIDENLLDSIRDSWLQPSPPDLDSIDYDTWLERKRDWFAYEFPWIFEIQKFLYEEHHIEVDYVELLMVSGDIWQFSYPVPFGQPIPVFDPAAIERIAKHFKVDDQQLLRMVQGSSFKSLVANLDLSTTTGPSEIRPIEAYQTALKNWQSAIASAAGNPDGLPGDLLMFSLHASTYLANTRTTAWIWTRTHPEQAAALFTTWRELGVAFLDPEVSATCQQWLGCLRQDAAVANTISQLVPELITVPKAPCGWQAQALNVQLEKAVAALLASEDSQ